MYCDVSWERDLNLSSPVYSPFLLHTQPAHAACTHSDRIYSVCISAAVYQKTGNLAPRNLTQVLRKCLVLLISDRTSVSDLDCVICIIVPTLPIRKLALQKMERSLQTSSGAVSKLGF